MEKNIFVTQAFLPPLEEYIDMIKPIWDSHIMTNMGRLYSEFENKIRDFLEVSYASLALNGYMSLEMLIQAMNLKGEIITTPFTFAATTHAIVRNGAKPVFCDISEEDCNIDVNKIEELITDRTSAILAVHVFGNPCNVDEIQKIADKYGLKVVYDAAHAFGVKVNGKGIGNFGDGSIFSFHATKPFNSIEGGTAVFKEKSLYDKLYKLKNFGIVDEETVDAVGANAKLNEFQAAMGLCNLKYYEQIREGRKKISELYREKLKNVPGIKIQKEKNDILYNYAYFPIMVNEKEYGYTRNELYDRLREEGIYTRKYFYPLITDYDCYKDEYDSSDTPVALHISKRILALPIYDSLTEEDVYRICDIILGVNKE
ncbi:DegT/DnrJ/EryC1/StrS family aminotransferase [Clostridium sp. MSJ-8]|uniref:DegT/DnrJ/EryC1/StrS family aminotransferase n=1 Tax=Clostridium sp. MSJ-8 TaxID=2841510 RepID=UPI001C0EB742|nr:DegT/DnrJ/EryC1/StrS family aminotransferase [Clostridium sp. MSJ-8]MBU5488902.1 DegT/DnrJ/EryC1/StrS family aminotransferase [Clostridium sp. MSJ-8]